MNPAEYQARQAGLIELAREWGLALDLRVTDEGNSRGPGVMQAHLVCAADFQSVFTLSADTEHQAYVFTVAGLETAVTRHFRECHCDGSGVPR